MTNESTRDAGMTEPTGDSDAALHNELRREESERDAIGDVASDRNLSGSSSWLTLPGAAADAPAGGPSTGRAVP
jgi:hypothetical protein